MKFEELLNAAKVGDADAMEQLFLMYRPLVIRCSMVGGYFDEDLYQELSVTFLKCLKQFDSEKVKGIENHEK